MNFAMTKEQDFWARNGIRLHNAPVVTEAEIAEYHNQLTAAGFSLCFDPSTIRTKERRPGAGTVSYIRESPDGGDVRRECFNINVPQGVARAGAYYECTDPDYNPRLCRDDVFAPAAEFVQTDWKTISRQVEQMEERFEKDRAGIAERDASKKGVGVSIKSAVSSLFRRGASTPEPEAELIGKSSVATQETADKTPRL